MSEKYLSRSEFAALQGWAPSYITKLGHQGRLVFSSDNPKLIDVQATLSGLQVSADPHKAYLRQHHADERVRKHVTSLINSDAPSDEQGGGGGAAEGSKYWKSRALRENAMAAMAALELAKQRSELVERSRVISAAKASERMLSEAILSIPAQLAPEIAEISDTFQVEIRLRDALRKVLTQMAKAFHEGTKRGKRARTKREIQQEEY